jgi:argininosuccinate lyase
MTPRANRKKSRAATAPAATRKRPKSAAQPSANPLWGGRFAAGPDVLMTEINASIDVDRRLYAQDIAASKAHAAMLGARGIIAQKEAQAIARGLDRIEREIASGTLRLTRALEDIHMNVESRLAELIGPAAGRLHTARSRNDQVATDLRLWVRDAIDGLDAALRETQSALIDQAERHVETAMPGLTHLQPAQPVTFGHHLLAYVEMLGRDRERFRDCRARVNESPLGAVALAGTSFPIDREMTARALGFARPLANSIDAVADRDFALEFLAAAAIAGTHLSRLAEEIVIWSSAPFHFVRLSDAFSTGSSIMPQKRNPDAAELVRAKAGRLAGAFVNLLVVLKGLPLAYGKDLQEDKAPVFDAADTLLLALNASTGMLRAMEVDTVAMRAALDSGFLAATDLADWLVRELGMPFRAAHGVTGRAVQLAEKKGCRLDELPLAALRTIEPRIGPKVYAALNVERALKSRLSQGGTAPKLVRRAVAAARERFL